MLCGIIYAALWSAEACFRFGYASLLAGFSGSKLPGQKRRQAAALQIQRLFHTRSKTEL
jgi:hypothetical protein